MQLLQHAYIDLFFHNNAHATSYEYMKFSIFCVFVVVQY